MVNSQKFLGFLESIKSHDSILIEAINDAFKAWLDGTEPPTPKAKKRLTPEQKKALSDYKFAESEEDRYLGSVFVNPRGQREKEEKRRAAYEKCKQLGLGCEDGL